MVIGRADGENRQRFREFGAAVRRGAAIMLLLASTAAETQAQNSAPGGACPSDCNRDLSTTVDEIMVAVGIALGNGTADSCPEADSDADSVVAVDDILRAVNSALFGCFCRIDFSDGSLICVVGQPGVTLTPMAPRTSTPTVSTTSTRVPTAVLTSTETATRTPSPTATPTTDPDTVASGTCFGPGLAGLVPCEAGLRVNAYRCDGDRCVASFGQRTLLGQGTLDDDGRFSVTLSPPPNDDDILLFEVVVDSTNSFTRINFGPARARGRASMRMELRIDPDTTGTARALDEAKLGEATEEDANQLLSAVRNESAFGTVYGGQSPAEAIATGTDIAFDAYFSAPLIIVTSPDGRNAYATSGNSPEIVVYDQLAADVRVRSVAELPTEDRIERPFDVAVSDDGRNVYAVSGTRAQLGTGGAVFHFTRDAVGDLDFQGKVAFGQGALVDVVSGTFLERVGRHLYVAARNRIVVFSILANGSLQLASIEDSNAIVNFLSASPDGRFVYAVVTGSSGWEIRQFDRSQSSGNLTERSGAKVQVPDNTAKPVFGPDSTFVYVPVLGDRSILRYSWNPTTGALTGRATTSTGNLRATSIAIAPGGDRLLAGGIVDNDAALQVYDRSPEGSLTLRDQRSASEFESEGAFFLFGTPAVASAAQGSTALLSSAEEEALVVFPLDPDGTTQGQRLLRARRVRLPMPPANDTCANAREIDALPFRDVVDTSAATMDPTDPTLSCGAGMDGHSVWYRFTVNVSGQIAVNAAGYDTVVALHSGSCGSLVERACNDDTFGFPFSRLTASVSPGQSYFLEVTNLGPRPAGRLELLFNATSGPLCAVCSPGFGCGSRLVCGSCLPPGDCTGRPRRCTFPETIAACPDGNY